MRLIIEEIKNKISNIDFNILYYTHIDSSLITDEDRKVTIRDLNELKLKYEKAIENLSNEVKMPLKKDVTNPTYVLSSVRKNEDGTPYDLFVITKVPSSRAEKEIPKDQLWELWYKWTHSQYHNKENPLKVPWISNNADFDLFEAMYHKWRNSYDKR